MNWFKSIERWYDAGNWTKSMVGDAVKAGKIKTEQYKEITGEEYTNDQTQAEA